jgi:hypothetical protein
MIGRSSSSGASAGGIKPSGPARIVASKTCLAAIPIADEPEARNGADVRARQVPPTQPGHST